MPIQTLSFIALLTLCVLLVALNIYLLYTKEQAEKAHHEERKDLYNRIMAGSLDEYDRTANKASPPKGKNILQERIEKFQKAVREDAIRGAGD